MGSMLTTKTAILVKLKLFRFGSLVLSGGVVSLFALSASEGNNVSHRSSFLRPAGAATTRAAAPAGTNKVLTR